MRVSKGAGKPGVLVPRFFCFAEGKFRARLLGGRHAFWFSQLFSNARGQRLNSLDVGGHRPYLGVCIPPAVGKHAGSADAVFDYPKHLRFGVLGADLWQLGNRRKESVVARLLGFAWSAMAAGAPVEIEPASSDEIFVGGGNRIWHFGRFAANRGVDGRSHQEALQLGRWQVCTRLRKTQAQISESANNDNYGCGENSEKKMFHGCLRWGS